MGERGRRSIGRRLTVVGALSAALVVLPSPADAGAGPPASSRFVAVEPCRLLDTRPTGARIEAGRTERLEVAGRCGVPTDATAAAVTITASGPRSNGFVSVWPSGGEWPGTSVVNVDAGEVYAGSTIVGLGGGAVDLLASTTTDLLVDLTGYFVRSGPTAAGRFVAVRPTRLADTRTGVRPAAGEPVRLALPVGVRATAVAVNITVDSSSGWGYVGASPAGGESTSVLNTDSPGQTRAALAIVPASASGIELVSSAGDHLIVDLFGYFTGATAPVTSDGLYVVHDRPRRLLDTRQGSSPRFLAGGSSVVVPTAGGAAATVGTLTVTRTAGSGWFAVRPAATPSSGTSNLNVDGFWSTRANGVISPVSAGGLFVEASAGGHVIYDEVGYFTGHPVSDGVGPGQTPPLVLAAPPVPHPELSAQCASGDGGSVAGAASPSEYVEIGRSRQGRPIVAEYWGPPAPEHVVLIVANIHGNECAPERLVRAIRADPPDGSYGAWVIPALNPDGVAGHSRANSAGVDLNADGGTRSEPETRALLEFTVRLRPTLTIHVHSPNGMVGWFTPGVQASGRVGPGSPLAGLLAARISQRTRASAAPGLGLAGAGARPTRSRWFLWQGQADVLPGHQAVLVELYALYDDEVPTARPRPPTGGGDVAQRHARAILAALEDVL